MNEKIRQKRLVLSNLSHQAKEIREELVKRAIKAGDNASALSAAGRTLNSIIIEFFYKKNGHSEFKTFNQWKETGANIRRGEKGFIIWGRPLGVIKAEEGEPATKEEAKYFPISHLFSNMQVD